MAENTKQTDTRVIPVRIDEPTSAAEAQRIYYTNTTSEQREARHTRIAMADLTERNRPLSNVLRSGILAMPPTS